MLVKCKGGYRIRLENGKLLPKIYSSKQKGLERITQLKMFKKIKKK
jgi:hypothetical protein